MTSLWDLIDTCSPAAFYGVLGTIGAAIGIANRVWGPR